MGRQFFEQEGYNRQIGLDLMVPTAASEWMNSLVSKLLLIAILGLPLDPELKIVIPESNFAYPIMELISSLNFVHENYKKDSPLMKLSLPRYFTMYLKDRIDAPLIVLSNHLRKDITDKGELLQELVFHCVATHMQISSVTTEFKGLCDGIFKDCFFANEAARLVPTDNEGYIIQHIPGFSKSSSLKSITKDILGPLRKDPWSRTLKPCWTSFKSIIDKKSFNVTECMFLKPAPKSIGGDLYLNIRSNFLLVFQFKYHKRNDVTWSVVQEQINDVSMLLPKGKSSEKLKISLSFVQNKWEKEVFI